jgi:superfamily I DNA/RNA helicase
VIAELLTLDGPVGPEVVRRDGAWSGTTDPDPHRPLFDTNDLAAALERPGAAERFRVVEGSEELVQALSGSFDDWQVFLHPLQRQAAYETRFSGPARVSGGAGTGKTVVLLHRIKALLERPGQQFPPRILLTTFTPHLESDLQRLLARLVGDDRAAVVEIATIDALARSLHDRMDGSPVARLTADGERRLWQQIVNELDVDRSPTFLRNEYRHVLLARGVRSLDGYLATTRAGRGVALGPDARRALWPAFETFEARTRGVARPSTLQLTEEVAALLEQSPANLYDHVLVDEAQDLHAAQWRLLRALVPKGPDDLFIAGDAMQRIYGDTVSLRSIGIETRGRSLRLKRNYRSTHEIIGWALGVVRDSVAIDLDDLGTDLSGYHSVRQGPAPEVYPSRDRADELDSIELAVRGWLELGYRPDAIAVAARTAGEVDEIVTALQRRRLPVAKLGRRGRVEELVNVATMERLKGLEYPCVAVTGLSGDRIPAPGSVCPETEDRSQHLTDLQTERSLVYVAASRARDELALTWYGSPAELVNQGPESLDLVRPAHRTHTG